MSAKDYLIDLWGWLLSSRSAMLPLIPVVFHLLDKTFEKFEIYDRETIRQKMSEDLREELKKVSNKDVFASVMTYVDFERNVHFVLSIGFFCVVSLAIVQAGCTSTALPLVGMLMVGGFVWLFVLRLLRGKFNMQHHRPVGHWDKAAYVVLILTLGADFAFHLTCAHP